MTAEPFETRRLTVQPADAGERLDRVLGHAFADVSRSRFKDLITQGRVRVDGRTIVEPRHPVKPGAEIAVEVPEPKAPEPRAEAIPLKIIYEDRHLIVVDKPAGMVVHPAQGNWTGTLVNALIAHCGESLSGIGGVRRPGIVHRLDKDTTGLLVAAKTDEAHRSLSEQFAAHGRDGRLEREYLALVWGVPERRAGAISAPIARSATNRLKMAVARKPGGREATTRYEVVETFGKPSVASLLRCRLETGRTHQIRLHLAHIGHPLLGDEAYGRGFAASLRKLPATARELVRNMKRQALHAGVLGFVHPASGEFVRFEQPPPADMSALIEALRRP